MAKRYRVIDQQWIEGPRENAEKVKRMLLKAAAKRNLVIGIKKDGKGHLVTVEEEVED